MSNHLHIVCFDVPYPVSHGGYFDLFYKLKALYEAGIIIHLHCFEYGRGEQSELNKYCAEVRYYKRRKTAISFKLPYIVSSRIDKQLIKDLSADDHPILLEGTHCTYLLYQNYFPGRKILYRLHNIESIYYGQLYRSEKNAVKRLYFSLESGLLKKYEQKLSRYAQVVLTVSEKDKAMYEQMHPGKTAHYLPLFHPYEKIKCRPGKGRSILYHGNLAVAENEKVAHLLADVFKSSNIQVVVAGRHPSQSLASRLEKLPNFSLKADPSDEELEELIRSAHVNIIYSFNATGIKIKLLHALYSGRHCIVNEAALPGGQFDEFCHMVTGENDLLKTTELLMQTDFKIEEAQKRSAFLQKHFDDMKNAEAISAFLR